MKWAIENLKGKLIEGFLIVAIVSLPPRFGASALLRSS
jgi:hypothetical protein